MNRQLRGMQARLEDLVITHEDLDAKLRIYGQNEPKAVELRGKIVSNWDQVQGHHH